MWRFHASSFAHSVFLGVYGRWVSRAQTGWCEDTGVMELPPDFLVLNIDDGWRVALFTEH